MNIAIRKLALLEERIAKQEERNRIEGYVTNTFNEEFKQKITDLMLRVRTAY